MAKPESLPYCQGLSLWERWHGVSRDGEGEAVLSVYYLSLFIQAVTVSFQLTVLIQAHPHPKTGERCAF